MERGSNKLWKTNFGKPIRRLLRKCCFQGVTYILKKDSSNQQHWRVTRSSPRKSIESKTRALSYKPPDSSISRHSQPNHFTQIGKKTAFAKKEPFRYFPNLGTASSLAAYQDGLDVGNLSQQLFQSLPPQGTSQLMYPDACTQMKFMAFNFSSILIPP